MLNTVEKVLLLQDIEFLTGAPTESLARLAAVASHEDVPPGARLFEIGDRPQELLFLVSGQVTETNREDCSCTVEQTGLDFLSVLGEVPHIVSARVLTGSRLLKVSLDDLVELLSSDAEFSWRVLRHVSRVGRGTCSGDPVPEYPQAMFATSETPASD